MSRKYSMILAIGVSALFSQAALAASPNRHAAEDSSAGGEGSIGREASAPVDATAAGSLAGSIRAAMLALPSSSTQGDYEAAIVYAIDQGRTSIPLAIAAVQTVDRAGLSNWAQLALNAVLANRSRLAARGTGTVAGAGGPAFFGSASSISGGSADYATAR